MKSFFFKFFHKKKKEKSPDYLSIQEDMEIDQLYISRFTNGGGKFIYVENWSEALQNVKKILFENQWENSLCISKELANRLKTINISRIKDKEDEVFFCYCEGLLADKGNIVLSSRQTKGISIYKLPKNFIVFATPKQILPNLSSCMQVIKKQSSNKIIISHIKCIVGNGPKIDTLTDFGIPKNIFLLLVEDLYG